MATGNWGTAGTWTSAGNCNRVPTNVDDVTIANGHTITMNGNSGNALSLTINGIATWTQNRTTNVGTGGITINGDITGSSNGILTSTGTLTLNNVTLTSNTVTLRTQTTAGININGTGSVALLAINSATTNNGTLTVRTTLSGTNTLTNAGTATLNIGGTSAITTLTATAVGNTVNYTGAAQTVKATTYHHLGLSGSGAKTLTNVSTVNGNLTLSGTATATTAIGLSIGGNLDVGSGTTFTSANFTNSVAGTTSVTGTLAHSGAATKTYVGGVTVNAGGIWTNTRSAPVTFRGGLTHNGTTFTAGTGIYTFNTNSQAIGGTSAIAIPSVTVTGVTLTNNGTLTVATALAGTGGLTNSVTGTLNIGGTSAITTLTATAVGNTVNYTGAAQTVKATTYHHLGLSGSGANPLGGDTTIGGILTLSSGTLSVGANTLTLNGPAIGGTATNLTTASSSSLTLGGSSVGITIPGSVTALNNLTINNSSGVSLGGSSVITTLSGTLALDTNNLTTGTNTLILAGNCTANSGNGSLTRTSGYVIGNLKLTFPVGSSTCTYHVGDSIGYSPITVAMAVTGAGTLSGRVDAPDHPDTVSAASGIDAAKSANHYWTLTAGTLTYSSYSATFQFCANSGSCTVTEVDSGANTSNFIIALKTSGIWSTQVVGTKNAYSTQATGITSFGEFAIGELSTNNCYNDGFTGADGSSPGANWSVGNKSGTFGNPVIFGNRLRLTNASGSAATWATLQKLFPAAGNKVTVEFEHFAYGGTGNADGIAVVLSDASVAPQAGAFGGSLGYAQKSNPGSDCTTIGGCPGFAGGWLGIAVDEYGNFSTNTEGRFGGSATRILNSVAVRGSGSGMSGYRFLLGTGTLSPVIDGNGAANPPHRYRIIVDHTDSVHAWASVERDTSGGGTAYTTLIGCPPGVTSGCTAFDVKDPGNSQNAVPAYWNLSFTGSTGASTNIHEVDTLKVCTVQGLASPILHHIQIEHGGGLPVHPMLR